MVPSISFHTFLYRHLKFSMLLLYILWDDRPIFMISGSNERLQQELEYTLLKPDCHSWWISKMQSGRRDTLEEWYAIKFCFKLGKNAAESLIPKLRDKWGDERDCDEGHRHAHTKGLPWGLSEVFGMVQQVDCSRRRLLRRGLEFHVCTINKCAHTKKGWKPI